MASLNIDDFSRERKTKQINFRLSPSEYLHVKEQADKLGVSVSTYCQVLSVKTKIKAPARASKIFLSEFSLVILLILLILKIQKGIHKINQATHQFAGK